MNHRPELMLALAVSMAACDGIQHGGGTAGGDNPSAAGQPGDGQKVLDVGGTVSGLVGSGLVLQNNGADDLAVSANGGFRFDTSVASGGSYAVTVKAQPTSPVQACTVSDGTGTVGTHAVESVIVSCSITGTFSATGGLDTARAWHTATLLPDGKVLVTGGFTGYLSSGVSVPSAEVYDPASAAFTITGNLATARYAHTATLLPSGKVLVVGGKLGGGFDAGTPIRSAELYDPATGAFTATGDLVQARDAHTSTLLPNGKVLIAGGFAGGVDGIRSAELYDPTTGTFTATGSLAQARYDHAATRLPNGKVLITGGIALTRVTTAELYDPDAGTFTPAGSEAGFDTATLLPDGNVLLVGLSGAELYDGATGAFIATGSPGTARQFHTGTLLANARVLIAGGTSPGLLASAELYDPAAGAFAPTDGLHTGRYAHTATLLPGGDVLVAGGEGDLGTSWGALSSAELYHVLDPRLDELGALSSAPRAGP